MINNKLLLEKIKKQIKLEGLKKEMSLVQVSEKLGKNKRYISNMFSKQDTISIDTIYEIAEAIGCEPIDLIPELREIKE